MQHDATHYMDRVRTFTEGLNPEGMIRKAIESYTAEHDNDFDKFYAVASLVTRTKPATTMMMVVVEMGSLDQDCHDAINLDKFFMDMVSVMLVNGDLVEFDKMKMERENGGA